MQEQSRREDESARGGANVRVLKSWVGDRSLELNFPWPLARSYVFSQQPIRYCHVLHHSPKRDYPIEKAITTSYLRQVAVVKDSEHSRYCINIKKKFWQTKGFSP